VELARLGGRLNVQFLAAFTAQDKRVYGTRPAASSVAEYYKNDEVDHESQNE
jgi:hypothetical protein